MERKIESPSVIDVGLYDNRFEEVEEYLRLISNKAFFDWRWSVGSSLFFTALLIVGIFVVVSFFHQAGYRGGVLIGFLGIGFVLSLLHSMAVKKNIDDAKKRIDDVPFQLQVSLVQRILAFNKMIMAIAPFWKDSDYVDENLFKALADEKAKLLEQYARLFVA